MRPWPEQGAEWGADNRHIRSQDSGHQGLNPPFRLAEKHWAIKRGERRWPGVKAMGWQVWELGWPSQWHTLDWCVKLYLWGVRG